VSSTSLADAIRSAFADNTYRGDDHITVFDPGGRKYDETFQLLRGCDWREMPIAQFFQGDTPIPDLAPEAFHYYMPALLLASINDDFDLNSDLAFSLGFFLSPQAARQTEGEFPYDQVEAYNRRLSLFTETQREVIARVLLELKSRGWIDETCAQAAMEAVRRGRFE